MSANVTGLPNWIAAQMFFVGLGGPWGLLLVAIVMVWKTHASPRVVTIAGLSVITIDFLAYSARRLIQFGAEHTLQNDRGGLFLLAVLVLLMWVVWKSASKWVSLLAVLLGLLMMFPSGFLLGWYLDNWMWSGPDVDNLILSALFAVGAVLVLAGGAGALLRRSSKVRASLEPHVSGGSG